MSLASLRAGSLASAAFLTSLCLASTARAQDAVPVDETATTADGAERAGPKPSGDLAGNDTVLTTGQASTSAEQDKYAYFDSLTEPGLTTNFPGSADSILRDVGGFRSWLADRHIGLQGRLGFVGVYNPLDKGQPRSPQRYNGQSPTMQTLSLNLIATIGLDDIGLSDSRIILGGNALATSFYPNGPNTVGFRNIAWYQSFADGKVELKFGIMPEYYEFVGFYAGGSPVLASGVTGLIPIQAGLSADPAPTPAANLTVHLDQKKGIYFKGGIQRSTAPAGTPYELENNGPNVAFKMKDAGPLYIGELGVRRAAKPGEKQIWLRGGGLYNDSNYQRFDRDDTDSNASIYGAADFQVTQPDPMQPGKGFYAGFSAFWAPSNVNRMTQTYEARVYKVAPFESRPKDSTALRLGYSKFSPEARRSSQADGLHANGYQLSVTGSYSYHVAKGLYFTPAVAYIKNPSFIGDFNDALSFSATIFALL